MKPTFVPGVGDPVLGGAEVSGSEMPDRMHIAHVDPEMGFSGGEVQVFLLVEGLLARGHQCSVIAQPGSRVEAQCMEAGIEVANVPMRADWDLRSIGRLTQVLKRWNPDLVHLHTGRANWLGGWAAKRAGVPAVSTRRMDRRIREGWKQRRIYGEFVSRTAAISPAVLESLHAGGVPQERTELIWSVVDPARLEPSQDRSATRAALGVLPEQTIVLAAGALVPRKGFDVLIEAFVRLLKEPKHRGEAGPVLCIAGGGGEESALQRLVHVHGAGSRIRLLGSRSDMPDLLAASDVFAMPSRAEGLGVAALEAMGAGLPVIASAVGGLKNLVLDGETGVLLEVDDVRGWQASLQLLIHDSEMAAQMGKAGKARVRASFLPEQMVDAYEKFYSRARLARI